MIRVPVACLSLASSMRWTGAAVQAQRKGPFRCAKTLVDLRVAVAGRIDAGWEASACRGSQSVSPFPPRVCTSRSVGLAASSAVLTALWPVNDPCQGEWRNPAGGCAVGGSNPSAARCSERLLKGGLKKVTAQTSIYGSCPLERADFCGQFLAATGQDGHMALQIGATRQRQSVLRPHRRVLDSTK